MRGYAIISKDGSFLEGDLPGSVDKDRFCIMCAATFGAGDTAQREIGQEAKEVIIRNESYNIIIRAIDSKRLLLVIGTEKDVSELLAKMGNAQ